MERRWEYKELLCRSYKLTRNIDKCINTVQNSINFVQHAMEIK